MGRRAGPGAYCCGARVACLIFSPSQLVDDARETCPIFAVARNLLNLYFFLLTWHLDGHYRLSEQQLYTYI
jgi:hypothetical protein